MRKKGSIVPGFNQSTVPRFKMPKYQTGVSDSLFWKNFVIPHFFRFSLSRQGDNPEPTRPLLSQPSHLMTPPPQDQTRTGTQPSLRNYHMEGRELKEVNTDIRGTGPSGHSGLPPRRGMMGADYKGGQGGRSGPEVPDIHPAPTAPVRQQPDPGLSCWGCQPAAFF